MKNKLIKNKCEIESCNISDPDLLEFHHIIPRSDINTNNHPQNLAILCACCHALLHSGKLRIISIYPSTKPPNHRTLVYELNGVKNINIDEPYLKFENKSYKI